MSVMINYVFPALLMGWFGCVGIEWVCRFLEGPTRQVTWFAKPWFFIVILVVGTIFVSSVLYIYDYFS